MPHDIGSEWWNANEIEQRKTIVHTVHERGSTQRPPSLALECAGGAGLQRVAFTNDVCFIENDAKEINAEEWRNFRLRTGTRAQIRGLLFVGGLKRRGSRNRTRGGTLWRKQEKKTEQTKPIKQQSQTE